METTIHDPHSVCEACLKKTRIVYKGDGAFFQPKIKRINYLQLGRSKMITNPLVLFTEWFYQQYKKIRNVVLRLKDWLFPRRPKLWCHHPDSQLVGSIHYASRDKLNVPIHNLCVEFWARTQFYQWRKLAEGHSDYDGNFTLDFELRQARNWNILYLQFEIYQTTHVYYGDDQPRVVLERCYTKRVPMSNLIGMRYNLRTINLPLWEYRTDTPIPRVVIPDLHQEAPQYYSQGRIDALYQQIIPLEAIKIKHLAQIAEAPETLSLEQIQRDYPENLTVCIEKKLPGYTRGDEWFGKRMMNGMNRGTFMPDAHDQHAWWIKYFGICNYEHNLEYALPTVEIKFRLREDGLPTPVEIHITGAVNAYHKDPWQKRVFTPDDGDNWLYAKRVARVNGAFCTEVDEHFTGTHLNTEQYAIAAYRNFRLNPIACLLFPHVKEVSLINHSADSLLIHQFIPTATALTENGLHARNKDILGMQDWKNWTPMKALSHAHSCALAEQKFWDITVQYVEHFFRENEDDIKRYWPEVYRFSNDLVRHAVPVFLSDTDLDKLSPEEKKLAEDRFAYYTLQYCFDAHVQRETIDGELKVVSPITRSEFFDQAAPEDLQNLKQACAYIIMMATYMHTWINEHQYDDLGEIMYSCGGLRFGDKESGILAPESDLSIAPDLTRATQTLWFTNFLSRTEYGFITRNEEGDINPVFSQMLLEKEAEFAALGVDVTAIESRTNI